MQRRVVEKETSESDKRKSIFTAGVAGAGGGGVRGDVGNGVDGRLKTG